ncbi:TIGR01777 family oxidoreductase [Microaerobacter geothermalis]|uniref:TIGR01777 family oxidoreductase n=1 Tax=Microaerobacter geothermalis TaxID=674972 RepID=UPI001F1E799C|nr:TIGR01777 family oxidoreductase [Microaerobacter geothermalis]MCF6092473.1 TIGR01777 family oxidoreductase [Microaerobacter geothermalis]
MKIAISGGTGFIGSYLVEEWLKSKIEVVLISRNRSYAKEKFPNVQCVTWGQLDRQLDQLEGIYALVNLAGESISTGRWTKKRKRVILQSRLDATRNVTHLVSRLTEKPEVVINGSAIGIYGYSETDTFDENQQRYGCDFLAKVVQQWENEADKIKGTRVVKLRTGIVLGLTGGAFPKMLLPYTLGIGGKIGSGRQWLSWIHVLDMIRLIQLCIEDRNIEGPVNAVAPNPVTNDQFGRILSKVLKTRHWLPVPGFVLQLIFGEMSEILLKGQRVYPKKLLDAGFVFTFENLEEALVHLLDHRD